MQNLNDVSVRQCHPTDSPLKQATNVPHNTKKSVLDAWNRYHSVAIREKDRHILHQMGQISIPQCTSGKQCKW